jgi:dethiobiotin synthetase
MQGVFITGTNTGVGKTYIGVLLAKQLTQKNVIVIPRKPIESGCLKRGDELIPNDASALKKAANYEGALSEVCPYRFEPPISPVRAAHLANIVLTTEQLVNTCLQGSEKGFVLVEGAGGFYSPLSEDGLNADLAMALQLPILLVANDALGCLNQVFLSAEAIKMRGLNLVGVVLNSMSERKEENIDNAADLRESLDCPVYSQPYRPVYSQSFIKDGSLPDGLIEHLLSKQAGGNVTRLVG